jgi:hypothetical protein
VVIAHRSFLSSTTLAFLCFFLFMAPLANVLLEEAAERGVVVTALNIKPHVQMINRHHRSPGIPATPRLWLLTPKAFAVTPKAFTNFSP